MKKTLLLLTAALFLHHGPLPAQDWKESLKKAASKAADKATDGKSTQYTLIGTWDYTAPGIKFESDDTIRELAAAALTGSISRQLEKAYLTAGIRPGVCSFTFRQDGTFSAATGTRSLSGTFEFEAATHVVTLRFAKGKLNLGSVQGHAYSDGERLQLLFPVTGWVDLAAELGNRISSLSTITELLRQYENIYLGFEFERAVPK